MELERINGFASGWWVADGPHEVLTEEDEWSYWAVGNDAEGPITDDTKLRDALMLGPLIAAQAVQEYRRYNPLADCPGLHRTFASLPLATEAEGATEVFKHYCAFAARYGLLTGGRVVWRARKRDTPDTPVRRVGDITLDNLDDYWAVRVEWPWMWDEEIHWFREAIRVWDGLLHKRHDLREVIRWADDGGSAVWYQHPEQRFLGTTRQSGHRFAAGNRRTIGANRKTLIAGPGAWRDFTPHDVKGPARAWLTAEINERLAGHVSPSLSTTDPPRVSFVPASLRDAMVVSLFLEVSGQSDLRQCSYCKNWFDAIKPDGTRRRADARYCSNSCKTQASRQSTKRSNH